jgi:plasmid stabilization system protein ParE
VKPVRLRTAAKLELRKIATRYRDIDPELCDRFLNEVFRTLALLERFPHAGSMVFGIADASIRQLPVPNFPYLIIFKRLPERSSVLGIRHYRQEPLDWTMIEPE